MDVRGLVKFSLVDYPGKICSILFMGGCNFKCPFCHNPCLVFDPSSQPRITEKELKTFLTSRQGLVEGFVLSGGEPTLQNDLPDFAKTIKQAGFFIKVDTNGTRPTMLQQMFESKTLDALGIDYKAPLADYATLSGNPSPEIPINVQKSIRFATENGIELDIRTTVHRDLLSPEQLKTMRDELSAMGVKTWVLQQYHPVEVIDDKLSKSPTYGDHELIHFAKELSTADLNIRVRGLTGRMLF